MKRRRPTIAVFVESSRESGRSFLRGVANYIHSHGDWLVVWQPEGLQTAWPLPVNKGPFDAVIGRDVGEVEELMALDIPCVVFGHARPEFPKVINVTSDNHMIGRMAAEHLLACGFRHFAYCGASGHAHADDWSQRRREAFTARLAEAGFSCATDYAASSSAHEPARKAMVEWLSSLAHPLGCMAANDDRAYEVAAACKEAGLEVPNQVGIVGVDNDELVCGFSDPPLSSVAVGFERAGYEAAEALDGMMRKRKRRARTIIASANHVVVRRSTDFTATADPGLAKALQFIRGNALQGMLSVADVAQAAGLSRRTLERRFRDATGMSLHLYISELRVERVCQLLVETSMPVAEIADELGFPDVAHFARFFRARRGIAPVAYRKTRQSSKD